MAEKTLPRFLVATTPGGNWKVIDSETQDTCPKLYKGTPAGDCVYPADDFQSKAGAERFASKMNKEAQTKRWKEIVETHGKGVERQIMIMCQH